MNTPPRNTGSLYSKLLQMTTKSQKTLERLIAKSEFLGCTGEPRMPSIKSIHELLDELNIKHRFNGTTNCVEYRSGGHTYVNERHDGKEGYEIEIKSADYGKYIHLNTANSYYSWNSKGYARDLVSLIQSLQIVV